MEITTPGAVLRPAHQWTGILLIFFIGAKMLSGLNFTGAIDLFDARVASWLHFSKWIDIPLVFLFCFHAAFGVLRIFFGKVRNKWRAFLIAGGIALVLSLAVAFVMYS